MSLDDFVITHFTKGPGVDTLSTKIYSEVRKGIKPEMYALSTLLFVSVLILLILINVSPTKRQHRQNTECEKISESRSLCTSQSCSGDYGSRGHCRWNFL